MKTEIENAIEVLVKNLNEDEGYRISWRANIAMAFVDESLRSAYDAPIKDVANNAAENFLKLLCRDTKKTWTKIKASRRTNK